MIKSKPSDFKFFKISKPFFNPGPLYESTDDLLALSNEALKISGLPKSVVTFFKVFATSIACSSVSNTFKPAITANLEEFDTSKFDNSILFIFLV